MRACTLAELILLNLLRDWEKLMLAQQKSLASVFKGFKAQLDAMSALASDATAEAAQAQKNMSDGRAIIEHFRSFNAEFQASLGVLTNDPHADIGTDGQAS